MVVVPGEPLGEVEVLSLNRIRGMEEDVEAPVLEPIVELLDLPVVLGMVGFIPDVGNPRLGTGFGEPGAPLPSTVGANGTDDEGGVGNDVMEEGDRTVLVTVLVEFRHGEPRLNSSTA